MEWLRSFIAIADKGSFAAAAKSLYLTPTVVTRHVAALEREVGARLFDRTTRSVVLTRAGASLLPHARTCVASLDAGLEEVAQIKLEAEHTVEMGWTYLFISGEVYRDVCSHLAGLEPSATLKVFESDPLDIIERLVDGCLDCALVGLIDQAAIPRTLRSIVMFTCDEVVLVGQSHELAKRESLSVDDLVTARFIYPSKSPSVALSPVRLDLAERGIVTDVSHLDHMASALTVVASGERVMDVPTDFATDDPTVLRIPYRSSHRISVCFVWNPSCTKPEVSSLAAFFGAMGK